MRIKYAKVTTVNDNNYKVTFLGETIESTKTHTKLVSYDPVIGDTVAFVADEIGKYLCLGKAQ